MERVYEGRITKRNFGFARFKLETKLLFYRGKSAVRLYWDCEESAPTAKIDGRNLKESRIKILTEICSNNDFMIKRV